MAKISITDLKQSITTLNVPVKKTVIWNVEVTESNVASLKKLTKNSLLELGE
ncbi:TPA: phage tail assembly chaperone family protein, TAC, partial [Acinetobacter baumannii]